jgi:hypothetical protein
MSEEDENNFYRLVAFVVDVAPEVIREYFKRKVLHGDTFESYLNKHKHILYHLVFLRDYEQSCAWYFLSASSSYL